MKQVPVEVFQRWKFESGVQLPTLIEVINILKKEVKIQEIQAIKKGHYLNQSEKKKKSKR